MRLAKWGLIFVLGLIAGFILSGLFGNIFTFI